MGEDAGTRFVRSVVEEIEATRSSRKCNGDPNGTGWCGKLATVVCTADDGLQWYACDEETHRKGAKTMAIGDWWKMLDALAEGRG